MVASMAARVARQLPKAAVRNMMNGQALRLRS